MVTTTFPKPEADLTNRPTIIVDEFRVTTEVQRAALRFSSRKLDELSCVPTAEAHDGPSLRPLGT